MAKKYTVKGKVWLWPGEQGAWHFVHIDKKTSETIKEKHTRVRRGFGSVRVIATIGKTSWKTSIFPDRRSGTYLLPLKASVRNAEGIAEGDSITFSLDM
ncbi:DUF1905 domain-containing protein [Candidatus Kaiserbacteria bacterium]|nr:DUF1905 domain-containing protein [Candidatus Kaiserbacteria bacterium]